MQARSKAGFSLLELAVVTVLVTLVVLVLLPAFAIAIGGADMTAVGTRGRDIYVAIVGANTERESVGLSPLWPADAGFYPATTNGLAQERWDFANSTDYFMCLCDASHLGQTNWSPYVAGFDYSKLSGAGVPVCRQAALTAEFNMWTIAKNVRNEMDDVVPVLITRNIDASSLASKVTERDCEKRLRFDPKWETPFGDKAYILIRKGGAIFKARAKYMSYRIVYLNAMFDAAVDAQSSPFAHPLKYLTPTGEVAPGGRALGDWGWANKFAVVIRGVLKLLIRSVPLWTLFWGTVYLVVLGMVSYVRYKSQVVPAVSSHAVTVGTFHCFSTVLYSVFVSSYAVIRDFRIQWTVLALAIAVQFAGFIFVYCTRKSHPVSFLRSLRWLMGVPLVVSVLVMALVTLLFVGLCWVGP